jgi:hypothetical protein
MRSLECPHCRKRKITIMEKMFLSPGRAFVCPGCGGRMSVPASGIWVIIPAIVAAFAGSYMETVGMSIADFCAGCAVSAVLHCWYLPMVPK